LRELVEDSCVEASYTHFKDAKSWGVTQEADPRFAGAEFGTYKSADRLATEKKLREYMREPSEPRATTTTGFQMKDFTIVVTVAAPGTGKTRLVDDALRMPLDAKPNEAKHFDHFLRLAVTFNSNYSGTYAHPVTARMLLMFFCGTVDAQASIVLDRIDTKLLQLFPNEKAKFVAQKVLDALEALYCEQRGCVLERCRTVLLIDEISKAVTLNEQGLEVAGQQLVYNAVVHWLDGGLINGTDKSRRGAVFTGLSAVAPWSQVTPSSGRQVEWLPLGTFDLWDDKVRAVVTAQAESNAGWPAGRKISDRVWYLLAATGGRPRDVSSMLGRLRVILALAPQPGDLVLLNTLFVNRPEVEFQRYLLPSMLGIPFVAMLNAHTVTQFGRDCVSPALLNADQLSTGKNIVPVVPSVSLGHAAIVEQTDVKLNSEIRALITSTTFCKLDGSGKDFERVWVLLVHTVLRLQHIVRDPDSDFWPRLVGDTADLGGLARPKGKVLNVFADDDSSASRAQALFGWLEDGRVFKAPGSAIHHRRLPLTQAPTLAWWHSAWTRTVKPGAVDDAPADWPVALDVVWRPWTVAYFAKATHQAAEFALMVGHAGGVGDKAPHLYLFQCKALAKNVTQGKPTTTNAKTMVGIVAKLQARLRLLFSDDFAATHVWRRAGINSAAQVTLCVAAINLSDEIALEKLNAPFNIVLFDKADFRALGGEAFRDTHFFRSL
jgi:hypothetical protein